LPENHQAKMHVNLKDYYILSSVLLGNNMTTTFQSILDVHQRRVLECREVVGLIDQRKDNNIVSLRIDDGGGSYPLDLSLRLQKPEILDYPEAFFFLDENDVNFSFRVCARAFLFREWSEKDIWLK
jgi:hypothetical protein